MTFDDYEEQIILEQNPLYSIKEDINKKLKFKGIDIAANLHKSGKVKSKNKNLFDQHGIKMKIKRNNEK
jgi:regulation of enolase protein 1 (concanavalin A-like superfamily)